MVDFLTKKEVTRSDRNVVLQRDTENELSKMIVLKKMDTYAPNQKDPVEIYGIHYEEDRTGNFNDVLMEADE